MIELGFLVDSFREDCQDVLGGVELGWACVGQSAWLEYRLAKGWDGEFASAE